MYRNMLLVGSHIHTYFITHYRQMCRSMLLIARVHTRSIITSDNYTPTPTGQTKGGEYYYIWLITHQHPQDRLSEGSIFTSD
jgi:hypothetical protein